MLVRKPRLVNTVKCKRRESQLIQWHHYLLLLDSRASVYCNKFRQSIQDIARKAESVSREVAPPPRCRKQCAALIWRILDAGSSGDQSDRYY